MYRVKGHEEFVGQGQRICFYEWERVKRLLNDVNTRYIKSCPVVAHGRTASTAKKVKELHEFHTIQQKLQ
jgi:hypothetical protein